ncbi:hypothetical protein G2W53_033858 [Senna tora]|uniref:Transposase n=1 Tax=Senna tora TaxID=362788 RepID=A0A834T313_9FABA|nr:hypothetical protein G2W53_033858 [Senna tora]
MVGAIKDRTLINFLVHCTAGVTFVKSVDASDLVKDAQMWFNLFSEVIEWVGPSNVVHIVTDNAANYVAVGKEKVWKEIVRPGVTRFATTFITLKSIHDHKHHLQALVTHDHFVKHRAKKAIKEMFKGKKEMYKPYTDIIKARWHKHFREEQYNSSSLRLLEIEAFVMTLQKDSRDASIYDRKGSFGRESARTVTRTIRPEEAPPDFDDQEFDNENVIYQEHAFPAESSRQGVEENDMNITDQPILDVVVLFLRYKMAYIEFCFSKIDVFVIPISIISSEVNISMGGRVLHSFRSSLRPTTVEALVCAQNWLRISKKEIDLRNSMDEIERIEESVNMFDL